MDSLRVVCVLPDLDSGIELGRIFTNLLLYARGSGPQSLFGGTIITQFLDDVFILLWWECDFHPLPNCQFWIKR
jgi:hypothetical protein